jgi:hypothetical protein
MDAGFQAEKTVSTRKHTKLLHEGDYVAEVEVELIDADGGWGPYLSLEDVRKLDGLRVALQQGDIASALKCARVYRLTPITAAG